MKEKIFKCKDFEWTGKKKINYKFSNGDNTDSFFNVTRQNIFLSNGETNFDLRYFECEPRGYTTLEKHNHVHVVVVIRGEGQVIVGGDIYNVKPFDMINIPSWDAHQLINIGGDPFGFLCTVNSVRDSYKLLTHEEVEDLEKNDEIKKFIQIPNGYFSDKIME